MVVPTGLFSNLDTDEVQGSHNGTLVVLARLFSNSTPSSLTRAIRAFRNLGPARDQPRQIGKAPKLARRLSVTDVARLAERYRSGATVYELAAEFAIHRTTVSQHLHAAGVQMRRQPFRATQVEVAFELYGEGLSSLSARNTRH